MTATRRLVAVWVSGVGPGVVVLQRLGRRTAGAPQGQVQEPGAASAGGRRQRVQAVDVWDPEADVTRLTLVQSLTSGEGSQERI